MSFHFNWLEAVLGKTVFKTPQKTTIVVVTITAVEIIVIHYLDKLVNLGQLFILIPAAKVNSQCKRREYPHHLYKTRLEEGETNIGWEKDI